MKNIVAAVALVFLFFTISFVSYNHFIKNMNYSYSLNLNGYVVMDISHNLEENQTLRPKHSLLTQNDVDEVIYTYTVYVKNNLVIEALVDSVILHYTNQNKIDELDLINADILGYNLIDYQKDYYIITIDIAISIRQPENQDERIALSNVQNISFNLNITPKN